MRHGFPKSRRWQIAPLRDYRGLTAADVAYLKSFDREWAGTTSRLSVHGSEHAKSLNRSANMQRVDALNLPLFERRTLFAA